MQAESDDAELLHKRLKPHHHVVGLLHIIMHGRAFAYT